MSKSYTPLPPSASMARSGTAIIIIIIIIINTKKTNVISFTRKTNSIHFDCHLGNAVITRIDCVKALGVWLDYKLYFHHHVNYIFSTLQSFLGSLTL
jgi:hypothetical protein